MDSLTPKANKLVRVTDGGDDYMGFRDATNTGDDYTYDANGNMLTDLNKGISTPITYNHLSLPEVISTGKNNVRFIYDASGTKLAQVTTFRNRFGKPPITSDFSNMKIKFLCPLSTTKGE